MVRTFTFVGFAAMGLCLMLAGAIPAMADPVTYTYTGNALNDCVAGTCGSGYISGFFTLADPLADNMAWTDITSEVLDFSFTDNGVFGVTIDPSNAYAPTDVFYAETDSNGDVVQWEVSVSGQGDFYHTPQQSASLVTYYAPEYVNGVGGPNGGDTTQLDFPWGYEDLNSADPGAWTSEESGPASVPEPGTFGVTLIGVGWFMRKAHSLALWRHRESREGKNGGSPAT
jgi:hypothetical protein